MKSKEELSTFIEEKDATNDKTTELIDDDLNKVSGGEIKWGPFHDTSIQCKNCGQLQVVYGFPTQCFRCKSAIYEDDYK